MGQADSEQYRRGIVRLATTLLNMIIGPAGAWYALGIKGVAIYIIVHTLSKWLSAEFSATNRRVALWSYRNSPWLLFLGGALPLFLGSSYVFVFLVPFLLGGFEGSYWCSFHGIRDHTKGTVEKFQWWELMTTLCAAFVVIILQTLELVGFAGGLGAVVSVIAWYLPMSDEAGSAVMAIDSDDLSSKRVVWGRLATGSFGNIQIISPWCMRVVALEVGGISGLSLLIAASAIVGDSYGKWYKRRIKRINEKEDLTERSIHLLKWTRGNQITAFGLLLMGLSFVPILSGHEVHSMSFEMSKDWFVVFVQITPGLGVFVLGYLICNSGISGILRPAELEISLPLFRGEGGEIGMRERTKFRSQVKLIVWSVSIGAFVQLMIEPSTEIWLVVFVVLAVVHCALNIYVIEPGVTLLQV